jgi:hypothetical protein
MFSFEDEVVINRDGCDEVEDLSRTDVEIWQDSADKTRQYMFLCSQVFMVRPKNWCFKETGISLSKEERRESVWCVCYYMTEEGYLLLETSDDTKYQKEEKYRDTTFEKGTTGHAACGINQQLYRKIRSHLGHQIVWKAQVGNQEEYLAATLIDVKINGRMVLQNPVRGIYNSNRVPDITKTGNVLRMVSLTSPGCNIVWTPRRHSGKEISDLFRQYPVLSSPQRAEGGRKQITQVNNVYFRQKRVDPMRFGQVFFYGGYIAHQATGEQKTTVYKVEDWLDMVYTTPATWLYRFEQENVASWSEDVKEVATEQHSPKTFN